MTTTDIAGLRAAAVKAAEAVRAEEEKAAAVRTAEEEARQERRIAWAWHQLATYQERIAAASADVATALDEFRAAVVGDYSAAPRCYLAVARTMGAANAIAEAMVAARGILKTAGILPRIERGGRDPVGIYAPFPPSVLPPFHELVESEIAAARRTAERVPATDSPEAFTGEVPEEVRRALMASEHVVDEELGLLLAVDAGGHGDRLTPEQRVQVEAYRATRAAAGHGDDALPRPAFPVAWRQPESFPTTREAERGWR